MTLARAAIAVAAMTLIGTLPLRAAKSEHRVTTCEANEMSFDHLPTARGEDRLDVPGKELVVEAPENGAVRLQGGDGAGFHVLACKAVAGGDEASLRAITVGVEKGRLVVHGPDAERWGVHLIVDVPKDAHVSVNAENGPVSVHGVSGSVHVDVVNGPVSACGGDGKLEVSAENGPVSLVDMAGDVKVDSQNGPLTVKLAEGGWRGAGLDARTENGPLSLRVPDSYSSGVEVSMSRRTPLQCSELCDEMREERVGSRRTLALGGARASVRLATSNGPVSIKSRT
jgi:hypothetical protein